MLLKPASEIAFDGRRWGVRYPPLLDDRTGDFFSKVAHSNFAPPGGGLAQTRSKKKARTGYQSYTSRGENSDFSRELGLFFSEKSFLIRDLPGEKTGNCSWFWDGFGTLGSLFRKSHKMLVKMGPFPSSMNRGMVSVVCRPMARNELSL